MNVERTKHRWFARLWFFVWFAMLREGDETIDQSMSRLGISRAQRRRYKFARVRKVNTHT